ncbi:sigma-70 family RNA polymerase sigma factor [Rhodovibrio salinarum]|uniref:RNA polymerase sigma factor n=1 Tax=Rhodovibrio salinarum TaxID=1087 RepID=A0A934QIT4_9PROT|nr:sigma-70 family RNA polymerase sigma factor [Rhodovibrio salinarum]MBK1697578.1 RNA polymerase subunit sigma [Rhodovibrio salinarum]
MDPEYADEIAGELTPAQAADLLDALAAGPDRQAFRRLFAHFAPRVKSYLRRLGAEDQLSEELAQEVMLTVWRRAQLYDRHQAGASTWIFTIARNKRIDAIRRDKRPELDPEDPAIVPEAETPADQQVEASQRQALLRSAVQRLPEAQATLLRLSYFEEKSHSAIAEELDLPLGTVKSRLRLALSRLKTLLEDAT